MPTIGEILKETGFIKPDEVVTSKEQSRSTEVKVEDIKPIPPMTLTREESLLSSHYHRPIKFRGRTNKGETIYGHPTIGPLDDVVIIDEQRRYVPVDVNTIQQLVVVIDGKPIYEGDVLEDVLYGKSHPIYDTTSITPNERFFVAWDDSTLSWFAKPLGKYPARSLSFAISSCRQTVTNFLDIK